MQVVHKKVSELTSDEYYRCQNLNLGLNYGWMRPTLDWNRQHDNDSRVVMLNEGSKLVGWGLLSPTKSHFRPKAYGITPYVKSRSKYSLMLYVRASHRGRGYGRLLFDAAREHDPRPKVFRSNSARALYSSVPVTTDARFRKELNAYKQRLKFYERFDNE